MSHELNLNLEIPKKKDLWLNIDSEKAIISWYNRLKDRQTKRKKSSKKTLVYENKKWRELFFELEDSFFF
jgi:hypothetical protein